MIRWIIPEKLGTAAYDENATDPLVVEIDVRTLVDKHGNSTTTLLEKISEGVAALEAGHSVVVVCDFGISRSNTVAAGILARWKNLNIDQAISEVVELTGESSIKLDMIETLRVAFGQKSTTQKSENILITGGNGFIGSVLARALAQHHLVYAPTQSQLDLRGPATALDRYCRERLIGKIVHLAYPRVYTNNEAMGESLKMLRNVLDACRSNGLHLILPSSWVVFSGYRTSSMDADVSTIPRPRGVYGETNFLQEALVSNATRNGEVAATIVRLSPIYGANGTRPRIIKFAQQYLMENRPIVTHRYTNGLPKLQLLYIDDAVNGLARIVKSGSSSIYHLAGTRAYEPRDIIGWVGNIMGRVPQITEVKLDEYTANVFLDSSSTCAELGWNPVVDIEEGLRRTLILDDGSD